MEYWDIFINGYKNYANFIWQEITFGYDYKPWYENYFYWLILVSVFFLALEWLRPWRVGQAKFRKDFWLDAFYMFFNFFIFTLIIYIPLSDVVVEAIRDGGQALFGFDIKAANPLWQMPLWAVLLIGFVLRDFIQWWVHRLLHRVEFLWEFHKVHHSVEEMGFAAHLRFHWMEKVVYSSLEYFPLALLIGLRLNEFFIIHIFALAWGHFNHSNITVSGRVTGGIIGAIIGFILSNSLLEAALFQEASSLTKWSVFLASTLVGIFALGPFMKKLFNNPEMHIWHHAYNLPKERHYGVNFGLTLAIWDYIFGTNYIPHDGRDIRLGFPGVEEFPEGFVGQVTHGLAKSKD